MSGSRNSIDRFIPCICLLLIILLQSCGQQEQQYRIEGSIFGTTYHIQIVTEDEIDLEKIQQKIDAKLNAIDNSMSTWKSDSELSNFNDHISGDWYPVSTELGELLRKSKQIYHSSKQAFDPTIGPLVKLWGFASDRKLIKIPDPTAIQVAKSRLGMDSLTINPEATKIRKNKNIDIDLSAIAKGYAVDQVAVILQQQQLTNFLIEIGGELIVNGNKNGKAWTVGIESPNPDNQEIYLAISVNDIAVATSGNYRNFVEIDGKSYSHIIDPRTAYPVEHKVLSVTVLAPDCATADAYATAFMVLGPEQALSIANQQELAMYMLVGSYNNFEAIYTDNFAQYLPKL